METVERYKSLVTERNALQRAFSNYKADRDKAQAELAVAQQGYDLCVAVNERLMQNFNAYYCSFANRIIHCFFGDRYEFQMQYNIRKDGLLEITPVLKCGDEIIDDLPNSVGGGLVDVTSFSLRLASILLSGAPKVMILDEPFKFLSADKQPLAVDLIRSLAEDFGMQFIIVTHLDALKEL